MSVQLYSMVEVSFKRYDQPKKWHGAHKIYFTAINDAKNENQGKAIKPVILKNDLSHLAAALYTTVDY